MASIFIIQCISSQPPNQPTRPPLTADLLARSVVARVLLHASCPSCPSPLLQVSAESLAYFGDDAVWLTYMAYGCNTTSEAFAFFTLTMAMITRRRTPLLTAYYLLTTDHLLAAPSV